MRPKFHVAMRYEPLWFGVRVQHDPTNVDGVHVITRVQIGLIPFFPIFIAWWNV